MEIIQYKLFIEPSNKRMTAIEVPKSDYYSFVRDYIDHEYSQIVVPSNILIALLKECFLEKKAKIVLIDFLEDDDNNKSEFEYLVETVNNKREYFVNLMEELNFLSGQRTVELKRIRLKYRLDGKVIDFSLSVNGLLSIGGSGEVEKEIFYITNYIWEKIKGWL